MSDSVTDVELDRLLKRAKVVDALGVKIAKAIELIDGVLDDLGEEAIAISFNGGKDCTVLLHLFAAVLYARHGRHTFPSSSAASSSSSNHLTAPNTISSSHSAPHPTDSKPNGHSHPPQSSQANVAAPVNGPTQPPPHLPSPSRSTSHPRSPPSPSTSTHHSPPSSSTYPYPPMKSIYITAPNPFPVLESFVLSSADRYGMDLYRFGGGMKAALNEYLGCGGGKGVRGVLVGTRRGDPNGDIEPLAPTDPSWPAFLRIHPILDWTYADVWQFLREMDVRWCSLYDEGYTSLGSTTNTVPNPLLRNPWGEWEPAWKLQDESQERAGRLGTSS